MNCDCVKRVNARLAPYNTKISTAFRLNERENVLEGSILVATEKADSSKRGKPRNIVATFCPFCGKDLRSAEEIMAIADLAPSLDKIKSLSDGFEEFLNNENAQPGN